MPLRLKLLLIALVAAVFPLAGWRFIVQMETALRESQERALMASARTLATALPAADPSLRGSLVAPAVLHARPMQIDVDTDGYPDDWGSWHVAPEQLPSDSGNLRAPDYWLGNTGASELNFSAMADWKHGRWRHTLSTTQFGQQFGILRASHTGSLSDLEAAIASDTPRNNLDYFTYGIDRPRQRVQHNVLKYKTVLRLNDVWKISGQYSFQYNQRREYDRGRKNVTESDQAQVSFQLWSNTLDAAIEHKIGRASGRERV